MKVKICSLLLLVIGISSCNKISNIEDVELEDWRPIAAFPLVNSEINVYDVINEFNHPEELLILENGQVALNYKGQLESINAEEILEIENQLFEESIQMSGTLATALDLSSEPFPFPVNADFPLDFSPSEVRIDEVLLSAGVIEISVTRLQDEFVSGELVINELLDENDQPITVEVLGNLPVGDSEIYTINLSGKKLLPTFSPPNTNRISLTGELEVQNNLSNSAEAGDFLDFSVAINFAEFESIVGDFGNLLVSADTDSIEINLFSNIQGGTFGIEEAILRLNFTNTFGLPMEFDLGEVVSVNQNTGEVNQLLFNDLYFDGQDDIGSSPEIVSFTFDNSNSAVSSLFSPAPVIIAFDVSATSNPAGPPPNSNPNFITSQSQLDAEIDLILPLSGYIQDVLLIDTIDVEISFDSYEEIDSMELKLQTKNFYPTDVDFQAFFLDENDQVIDSLFMENQEIISSAATDLNGQVVSYSEAESFITIDRARSELISLSNKVILRAQFDTYNSDSQQEVVFTADQKLDIKLGAKVYGKLEL